MSEAPKKPTETEALEPLETPKKAKCEGDCKTEKIRVETREQEILEHLQDITARLDSFELEPESIAAEAPKRDLSALILGVVVAVAVACFLAVGLKGLNPVKGAENA